MRTNIEIDDELMREAMEATGFKTKRKVVEEGLRLLARRHRAASAMDLFGKVEWVGDLDSWRRDEVPENGTDP